MAEPRKTRPVSWIKAALKEFEDFSVDVQAVCLAALTIAAEGGKADIAKPLQGLGSGVFEIALAFKGAFRVVYAVQLGDDIWVVHAFQKKSTKGIKTPQARDRSDKGPSEETEGDVAMKKEKLEVVRGSGNVFRDLGAKNADAEQFKAILAAEIIKALDRERLTVRAAHARTGIAAADFSRIRNADLGRFTVDRLMSIINRLGSRIDVKIRVQRERAA
jgi:phage-related protein/predicted XRE-type DNA-binding protein